MSSCVGRFAPTPSGRMHLGNVFSALMAWASVRSQNGSLILRVEDLDIRAHNPQYTSLLLDDLRWLGLTWDKGPYYQSRRTELYQEALLDLRQQGLLYPCFCSRADLHAAQAPHASDGTYVYAGTCRNLSQSERKELSSHKIPATRIHVPNKIYAFEDKVYGSTSQNLAESCGDFIVQRADGVFAYQLAVVVDDADMGITEVVRGSDLLSSTPRQLYLQDVLGLSHLTYAHLPLLVAPDGRRLSKRNHDLDLGVLRSQGKTPEEILGFLAYCVGLTEENEPLSAVQIANRFSWETLRAHRKNVVVEHFSHVL
ncbi:MAG: tRNA glutamyl-Q(34) synthetase GluQRS [Atopobium sp.]|nr:tRNA glutamyl-Q(34) synthetase GluQRS [Atopobium sp.]